jgi:hypothetical protein
VHIFEAVQRVRTDVERKCIMHENRYLLVVSLRG